MLISGNFYLEDVHISGPSQLYFMIYSAYLVLILGMCRFLNIMKLDSALVWNSPVVEDYM